MQTFNITSSVGFPVLGGIMSPANSIAKVTITGVQFATGDFVEAIGWHACCFKDQASADAENPLFCDRTLEEQSVGAGDKGCDFGGMIPTSDFTYETDTLGQLTQASLDSLKAVIIPKLAVEFNGVEESDLS